MFCLLLRTCRIETLSCSFTHFRICSKNIFVVVVSIMNFVDVELSSVGHSTGR